MTEQIGWHHPVDESDQWDGFNDPGIELYAGSPLKNLAREVHQNALDAGENGCVHVRILLRAVDPATIPDVQTLKNNLVACRDAARNESMKAESFFRNALEKLNAQTISVLEISDYNTKGMQGPSSNGTPYYAFMKARGQSRKNSDIATGSYGIGKYAPYAVSEARTIFVSTVFQDQDAGGYKQYTQGKSILMSHDIDTRRKQGVGFWGVKERCQPVQGVHDTLPDWLQRVNSENDMAFNKGSKLSILCFNATSNWQEFLAISVAENFFGAISSGLLKVDIDGRHALDRQSIQLFFQDKNLSELVQDQDDEPERFAWSREYLRALQDGEEVFVEESEMNILGRCQLRIMVADGLPKRVCFLRNGMFITDNLNRLKRFSDFKDFVAVFECFSDKGNALLRDMEPPRHDSFEPDRLPKSRQKEGARALKDVAQWIKAKLLKHAKDPTSDRTEISELREFFGAEGGAGHGQGEEEVNPYGKVVIRAKPVKPSVQPKAKTGSVEVDGGMAQGEDYEGGGGGQGAGHGDGQGGAGPGTGGVSGGKTMATISINNVRAVPQNSKTRKISFTPTVSGDIAIRVFEVGADFDDKATIVNSSCGNIQNGSVFLPATAGERITMDVELAENISGAIKVIAYEIR